MTPRYFVARFMEDLARRETKNIGIFYVTDEGVSARFLGEKPNGVVDLRTVRSLIQHTPTYKQWIDYWRDLLSHHQPPDVTIKEILESARGNFVVEEGQGLFLPPYAAVNAFEGLDYLYKLIVDEFSQDSDGVSVQRSLSQACNEIIKKYRLRADPHFHESPVIPIQVEGAPRHIVPSYQWLNGRDIYFQKVSIDQDRLDSTQKEVTSAAWMFERLKEVANGAETKALVKFSARDQLQTMGGPIDPNEYLSLLKSVSDSVIDVDDSVQVDSFFSQLR